MMVAGKWPARKRGMISKPPKCGQRMIIPLPSDIASCTIFQLWTVVLAKAFLELRQIQRLSANSIPDCVTAVQSLDCRWLFLITAPYWALNRARYCLDPMNAKIPKKPPRTWTAARGREAIILRLSLRSRFCTSQWYSMLAIRTNLVFGLINLMLFE